MLHTRDIHGTDLKVSQIALGTAPWLCRNEDALDRLYSEYRVAGGNCLDGAHCYAFWLDALGEPERVLGTIIRKHNDRNSVIVCTKGCHIDGGPKYPRPKRYMTAQTLAADLSDSLERLQMDYVDLYYLHRDDPAVPVDEIMDALHEQQRAGRIRHYAASNWQPARLEQAATYCKRRGIPPFVASQVLFNLAHLAKPLGADLAAINDQQEPWYTQHQMPVFAYSATGTGFFAEGRSTWASYDDEISSGRRRRCNELAKKMGATPSQIAVAYLMNQPFMVIPITGTQDAAHLKDTLASAAIRLSTEQVAYLRG